jgi:hypothetical protein
MNGAQLIAASTCKCLHTSGEPFSNILTLSLIEAENRNWQSAYFALFVHGVSDTKLSPGYLHRPILRINVYLFFHSSYMLANLLTF